jgi:hypothetical protein
MEWADRLFSDCVVHDSRTGWLTFWSCQGENPVPTQSSGVIGRGWFNSSFLCPALEVTTMLRMKKKVWDHSRQQRASAISKQSSLASIHADRAVPGSGHLGHSLESCCPIGWRPGCVGFSGSTTYRSKARIEFKRLYFFAKFGVFN